LLRALRSRSLSFSPASTENVSLCDRELSADNASDKLDATGASPNEPRMKKSVTNNTRDRAMRCCCVVRAIANEISPSITRERGGLFTRRASEMNLCGRRYAHGSVAYSRLAGNVARVSGSLAALLRCTRIVASRRGLIIITRGN